MKQLKNLQSIKKQTNYLVRYTYFLELKTLFARTALVWTKSDQASNRRKILEVVIVPILLKRGLMCHSTSWSNESQKLIKDCSCHLYLPSILFVAYAVMVNWQPGLWFLLWVLISELIYFEGVTLDTSKNKYACSQMLLLFRTK